MIPAHLLPRLQTGCLVFFVGRGPAPLAIRFGSWLGAKWRGEPVVRPVPHHVEVFERAGDGRPLLWGADAFAGFIPRPVETRLAGLVLGRDYRVLLLDDLTPARRDAASVALRTLHGRHYERWATVLKVWRRGNRRKTADVFCSESALEVCQAMRMPWALGRNDENESPLSLEAVASRHGSYLEARCPS